MKRNKDSQNSPSQLKGKLMAALAMLLVATVLMTSTAYAWIVLSVAPEVTGISTNIGANGSLEIALLDTQSRQDMSSISSGVVGESLANRVLAANNAWGNLVDLNDASYGLDGIILMPARIDAVGDDANGYTVSSGLLSVPTYGYDGRVVDVDKDAVSAVYANSEFSFVPAEQDYGVRAIGTSDSLSVQGSALAMAKSNVTAYSGSASNAASGSLSNNGSALFNDIMVAHMLNPSAGYDDGDLDVVMAMVTDLNNAMNYIELALRQGLVAYAASAVEEEDAFVLIRDKILNQQMTLSELIDEVEAITAIPESFAEWVTELESTQNELSLSTNSCNALKSRGAPYTWDDLRGAMDRLMNLDRVYINETLYPEFNTSDAGSLIGGDVVITLAPGSGVFANVADFVDDFNTIVNAMGTSVEITTSTLENPVYLDALYAAIRDLEAAGGSSGTQAITLSATYGYALDLAFRCNAADSDLLLQTSAIQRVYEESNAAATQGGGSYMEFTSNDEGMSLSQVIQLMDAVRVAFIDDAGELLSVAKLNTSNRQTIDGVVKAPLYLYDYTISEEDGMVMGERRKTDNTITAMQQNVAKAVTVVVWLDGDQVDNTMVSATEETSLSGMLNLQFASSADLVPAANTEYMILTADLSELSELVLSEQTTYTEGQGTYTTVSWNAYAAAYNRAVAVFNDASATDPQIGRAVNELKKAKQQLTVVSLSALEDQVDEIRELMGETADPARIVLEDENGNYYALGEYTQEQYDQRVTDVEIFRVDYEKNLRDEGNGIMTAIYSDASWSALAAALYDAETVLADVYATDSLVDAAMTALDTAHAALEHGAYFLPYDYNGSLYYYAVPKKADDDTYGKWYDAQFKRIVADKTILDLDAHAEEIQIAQIVMGEYVLWDTPGIAPYVEILDKLYPELRDEVIAGLTWNEIDGEMFVENMDERHVTALNNLISLNTAENLAVDMTAAENLLSSTNVISAAEAEEVINELSPLVSNALANKREQEAENAAAANPYMTSDQRTMLTKAVNLAHSIEGYSDLTNTELDALRSAAEAATEVLNGENPTKVDAEQALNELNAQLKANGITEVTVANTIVHTIPLGSEVTEIIYQVEYPGMTLGMSGKTGNTTLGAIGVTENGVIINITKNVSVYTSADGVDLLGGTLEEPASLPVELEVGETADIQDVFVYSAQRQERELSLGNVTVDDGKVIVRVGESARERTWASSDMSVAVVSSRSGGCTVTAVTEGVVTITYSVETEQDHVYTDSFTITVVAKGESTEP